MASRTTNILIEVMKCDMCVCKACKVNLRQCLKKKANGEPYKLRWQKASVKCCIPACENKSSADNHLFSLQDIFDIIWYQPRVWSRLTEATVYPALPVGLPSQKYQDIICCVCNTKQKHGHSSKEASKNLYPAQAPSLLNLSLQIL